MPTNQKRNPKYIDIVGARNSIKDNSLPSGVISISQNQIRANGFDELVPTEVPSTSASESIVGLVLGDESSKIQREKKDDFQPRFDQNPFSPFQVDGKGGHMVIESRVSV